MTHSFPTRRSSDLAGEPEGSIPARSDRAADRRDPAAWTNRQSSSSCRGHRTWAISAKPTSRSEEHTSELQSLMRISYAVFCLKKKKKTKQTNNTGQIHTIEILQSKTIIVHT